MILNFLKTKMIGFRVCFIKLINLFESNRINRDSDGSF